MMRGQGRVPAMSSFSLDLPEDFAEYEWQAEVKGWFSGARLTVSGKQYHLTFYDPVRLGQEIESEFERGRVFFEPNLVIVQSVTRANMERAAALLVESNQVASLVEG
jgi:hypothetical protein